MPKRKSTEKNKPKGFLYKSFSGFGNFYLRSIEKQYLRYYKPKYKTVEKLAKHYCLYPKERLQELEKIRMNNIRLTIWSNAGGVFGLIITFISLIATLLFSFHFLIPEINWTIYFIGLLVSFGLVLLFSILTIPLLLRKTITRLPPKEYAIISLTNLSQSEVLTLTAYKLWELNKEFLYNVEKSPLLWDLINLDEDKFDETKFGNVFSGQHPELIEQVERLFKSINRYKSDFYIELEKCVALKKEATKKLGIHPREFSNHVLKFSPSIFEQRVEVFYNNMENINHLMKLKTFNRSQKKELGSKLLEIGRIRYDFRHRGLRGLEQIIAYKDIHNCLIGMGAETSTSGSIKIFARGLSQIVSKLKPEAINIYRKHGIVNAKDRVSMEFEALIHRSKAHYGIDMLTSLENFYFKNYPESELPQILYDFKYHKKRDKDGKKIIKDKATILIDNIAEIDNIRSLLITNYHKAIKGINFAFAENLKIILKNNPKGRKYLFLIGYSKIVIQVIKNNAIYIRENDIKIFIIKEDDREMLDTRILKFELNDQKPNRNIRESFTGSDKMFFSLLNQEDSLIMIAGAEAYDYLNGKLIHTNTYQSRIEEFLNKIEASKGKKPQPEFWIVAGEYKIYEGFPRKASKFGSEFFADHYDIFDLYDLKNYPLKDIRLISNHDKTEHINLFIDEKELSYKTEILINLPTRSIPNPFIIKIVEGCIEFMKALGMIKIIGAHKFRNLESAEGSLFKYQDIETVKGSLFKRILFIFKKKITPEELEDMYDIGRRAFEIKKLGKPSAEVSEKLASSIEKINSVISNLDSATIILGLLIVVKITQNGESKIIAKTVNQNFIEKINSDKELTDPNNLYKFLTGNSALGNKRINQIGKELNNDDDHLDLNNPSTGYPFDPIDDDDEINPDWKIG